MIQDVSIADIASSAPRSIAIGPFGSALRADRYTQSGIPVVRGQNIGDRWGLSTDDVVFVARETAAEFPSCIVRPGDLVFPHRGAIGRVARVDDQEWLLSSSMMKLTVDPAVADSRFVLLYFRDKGRDELLSRASTVGTPGIGQPLTSLRSIRIPLPPLVEQQAIAEVLGALDDKIAVNTAIAEKAEALGSVVYDKITALWPRLPMSSVLDPILGGTPPRARDDYWKDGDQLWVSARDITSASNRVVIDTAEKITQDAVAGTKAKALPIGSVILTARGTVGQVGRLLEPASFNQSCYGFRPDLVPSGLLYFSILRATERAKAVAHGSVFDTITKTTFDHLDLAWDESRAAAAELAVSPILDVVSASVSENRELAAIRDTLLPHLMSGKLRVRDAEAAASDLGA
ncbi:restriction endonuclease subunit S [Curtobacterium sp. MCBA15_016]|uniref:restriction endonuclease subunit S n=1 Tax=Curtobacterium sp. MCBA15_016 TaxID=1898740 RepID=UPI0009F3D7C3|nr:restriction endonuclease subunit S [Curtobacterium sp. MCBA15_016]